MIIKLQPLGVSLDEPAAMPAFTLRRAGQALFINEVAFDFSVLPPGATLPDAPEATGCRYFAGSIDRDDAGVLHVTLLLPCATNAPEAARFPQPIINPPNGPIALPETNWPPAQTEQGGDDASN